jgi:DNA-binding transcriptional ArsR family regulator
MGKSTRATGADGAGRKQKAPAVRDEGGQTNRLIAMSHPLRARILRFLVERGVMSPAELSRELQADLRTVSYHVRRLEELECAELVQTRPVRGALEHFYRATERPMIDTDEFENIDPIMAEDLVLHTFQRMIDDFVASRAGHVARSGVTSKRP